MSIWLVGASSIAQDYARVLIALDKAFDVIGRGESSALEFERNINHPVRRGGVRKIIKNGEAPQIAIVAVGIDQLATVTEDLIRSGSKYILLEKPAGLDLEEVKMLNKLAKEKGANVYVAYNRRFYQSVNELRKKIIEDGGILSVHFEFTEWSHVVEDLRKNKKIKERWLLANSTHVIDLAFHLCGFPLDWKCWKAGGLPWHPASARFTGAGITKNGVLFSYFADWEAPGRWGVELMTRRNRFILRPMESLQVVKIGSVSVEALDIEYQLDKDFKPGIYCQTKAFLNQDFSWLCNISEQQKNMEIYYDMAGY
jgi:predicted dehydrogenase